jgi:hypothetical protein
VYETKKKLKREEKEEKKVSEKKRKLILINLGSSHTGRMAIENTRLPHSLFLLCTILFEWQREAAFVALRVLLL